jgi:C-terminal processing protease CtpA/Prc
MKKNIISLLLIITGNLFAQMPSTLSKSEKVYGLSKFWQEVNYNFVYLYKIDREKWENEYIKLITEVQETKNDYEYYRILQKFCSFLNDGHTDIYFPKEIQNEIYNTHFGDYRIFLTNISGKAIVTRVNLSKKEEIPIGTEIIKVNGLKISDYINEFVKPYISSSTEYIREDRSIRGLFRAPKGTRFEVEMKFPNGKMKQLALIHSETLEKKVYPKFEDRELLDFKWLKNKTAYISLNSFGSSKIDTLFIEILPKLYKAKKLIIDLRHNGGGSSGVGFDILQYLVKDTILYGSKQVSRLHIPAFKAWGKWTEVKDTINNQWAKQEYLSFRDNYYYEFPNEPDTVKIKEKRIVIPTVILIGHNTASAAEDFLIYTENQTHIVKIGEPTFGSTGQPFFFDLPGGGSARICTKKDTYPNGKEFVGYGILPDIEVIKSLNDYLENKDPALVKAIEYLNKK